jgi:hypothetical protein
LLAPAVFLSNPKPEKPEIRSTPDLNKIGRNSKQYQSAGGGFKCSKFKKGLLPEYNEFLSV